MSKADEVYEIAKGMQREYRLDDEVMQVVRAALFERLSSCLEKEEPYVEVELLPSAVDAGAYAAGIKTSRIDVRKTTLVLKKALQKAGIPVVGRDIVRQREKLLADMAKKEDSKVKCVKRENAAADPLEELKRQKEEKAERLRIHQEEREIRMRREATEERIRLERMASNAREREQSWWNRLFGAVSFRTQKTSNEKDLKK